MIPPKNAVADHWTWRNGRAEVTGYHWPAKKKRKGEDEGPVFVHRVSRGLIEAAPKPVRAAKPTQVPLL